MTCLCNANVKIMNAALCVHNIIYKICTKQWPFDVGGIVAMLLCCSRNIN